MKLKHKDCKKKFPKLQLDQFDFFIPAWQKKISQKLCVVTKFQLHIWTANILSDPYFIAIIIRISTLSHYRFAVI